jgi:hypothetical protein
MTLTSTFSESHPSLVKFSEKNFRSVIFTPGPVTSIFYVVTKDKDPITVDIGELLFIV